MNTLYKRVNRKEAREKRHLRIRSKISGTTARPRLCIYRSLENMFAQIVDDTTGNTLVSASTIDKQIKADVQNGGNIDAAKLIGKKIAERAIAKGIKSVVFDRSGYIFTGRVEALATAARESGLEF